MSSKCPEIVYDLFLQVKFLKSKEGSAMVQLGDGMSVERAILNLHNTFFFENKMQLRYVSTLMLISQIVLT